MKSMSEAQIQEIVAQYIRHKYPKVFFTATLGGLRLTPGMAKKIKSAGYTNGSPDLMIDEPTRAYHGLRIELKSENGRPSIEQERIIIHLNSKGYYATFAYSAKEAIDIIDQYLTGKAF